jgi:predicted transcriptional regulator
MNLKDLELRKNELILLGLKPSEQKIILTISKMAKPVALIARHAGFPRSSVVYMLKKLQEKSYVKARKDGKKTTWRSNISNIMQYIHNLENGTVQRT